MIVTTMQTNARSSTRNSVTTGAPSYFRSESMDSALSEQELAPSTGIPAYVSSPLHSRSSANTSKQDDQPASAYKKNHLPEEASQYVNMKEFAQSGRIVLYSWQLTYSCVQPTLDDLNFEDAWKEANEWRCQKDTTSAIMRIQQI